jgi:predicted metal-dependent RNase
LDEREGSGHNSASLTPKELFERIKEMLPPEAEYTKAEFEGPDIVVYMRKVSELYKDDSIIRNIATSIKKKLIIRSDVSALMDAEKAKEAVTRIVPKEAVIASIKFVRSAP